MTSKKKIGGGRRLATRTIAHAHLKEWFSRELPKGTVLPSKEQLNDLADELKRLLHRADNDEHARAGTVTDHNRKDVSPGDEADKRIRAVVDAVVAYENFLGTHLTTPEGDICLARFLEDATKIRLLYLPPKRPRSGRGRPVASWKRTGKSFAQAVSHTLKVNGYRKSVSLNSASSASVLIATRAINWAYDLDLTPEGFLSGIRERYRGK